MSTTYESQTPLRLAQIPDTNDLAWIRLLQPIHDAIQQLAQINLAAGPVNAIQYTDGTGNFAGSINFTFDPTTNTVTITGIGAQLRIGAGTGTNAQLRLIPGTAPISPVNGDVWFQADGLYFCANGTTFGPLTTVSAFDEGISLTNSVQSINFIGAGVTATNTGGAVTVNIPGGGSGGSGAFYSSPTAPTVGIVPGARWFNTLDGILYTYINATAQWVEL